MRRWGERLIYRQGNVLLLEVQTLPQDSLPLDDCVVAEGDNTGHMHDIKDLKSAILYEAIYSDDLYLQTITETHIRHPEHGCIVLPENTVFKIVHQREYVPNKITVDEILAEENPAVRGVMIERFGIKRFIIMSKAMMIDKDDKRELYAISLPNEEPVVFVRVQCPSTQHEYFLRVPPSMRTCHEAVAWTFNVNSIDYRPVKET